MSLKRTDLMSRPLKNRKGLSVAAISFVFLIGALTPHGLSTPSILETQKSGLTKTVDTKESSTTSSNTEPNVRRLATGYFPEDTPLSLVSQPAAKNAARYSSQYSAPGTPRGLSISFQRNGETMAFQSGVSNFENYHTPPAQIEFVVKRKSTGAEVARVRTDLRKPYTGGGIYRSPEIGNLAYDALYEVTAQLVSGNNLISPQSSTYTVRSPLRFLKEDYGVSMIRKMTNAGARLITETPSQNGLSLDIALESFSKPEGYEDPKMIVTLQEYNPVTKKTTASPIIMEKVVSEAGTLSFIFSGLKAGAQYNYTVEVQHEGRRVSNSFGDRVHIPQENSGSDPNPTKPTNPTGGNPTNPPGTGVTQISISNLTNGQKLESGIHILKGSFKGGSPTASIKAYYQEIGSSNPMTLFASQNFPSKTYSGSFSLTLNTQTSAFKDGKKYELVIIGFGMTVGQTGRSRIQIEISKKTTAPAPAPVPAQNVMIKASAKLSGSSYQISGTLTASARPLKTVKYYLWINNVRTLVGQQTNSSTTSKVLTINTKVAANLIKKGSQYKFEIEALDSSNQKIIDAALLSFF